MLVNQRIRETGSRSWTFLPRFAGVFPPALYFPTLHHSGSWSSFKVHTYNYASQRLVRSLNLHRLTSHNNTSEGSGVPYLAWILTIIYTVATFIFHRAKTWMHPTNALKKVICRAAGSARLKAACKCIHARAASHQCMHAVRRS